MNGWLALSPLFVFMGIYLVSCIIAQDFYKIPISAAFLLASVYAVLICRGRSIEERISIFSKGAGNSNVLLMIWIFVLAGAFASTAKEIGAIDATVNLALRILPGNLLYAGLFLAACFISMSIGTSVGTIVALVPIAAGIAQQATAAGPGWGACSCYGGGWQCEGDEIGRVWCQSCRWGGGNTSYTVSKAVPELSPGLSLQTCITVYAPFTPSKSG